MFFQAKTLVSISFAFAILLSLLIQSGCKKETETAEELSYISREDFMSKMEGEWLVASFGHRRVFTDERLEIYLMEDSVQYNVYPANTSTMYSIDDSVLCTLNEIENIQYWTISGKSNNLSLVKQDLCDNTKTYNIIFSNYRYSLETGYFTGKKTRTNTIWADIQLVSPYDTITLIGFNLIRYDSSHMGFSLPHGDCVDGFALHLH
jgi:hypothetical protein